MLLSYSGGDDLIDLQSDPTYGFPAPAPVYGSLGVLIADSWADVFLAATTPLYADIQTAVDNVLGAGIVFWWAGTLVEGTVGPDTCLDWTSSIGANDGFLGTTTATDSTFYALGATTCDLGIVSVMCGCYSLAGVV